MHAPGRDFEWGGRGGGVVRRLGAFAWDFVIGDDWVGAAGVVVVVALTWVLVHVAHMAAWWALPSGVVAVLAVTLRRAVRRSPVRPRLR